MKKISDELYTKKYQTEFKYITLIDKNSFLFINKY